MKNLGRFGPIQFAGDIHQKFTLRFRHRTFGFFYTLDMYKGVFSNLEKLDM